MENQVSHDGKYFQLKNATLEPKPFQKPHPPIWIGGSSEAIKRLVAEVGDGWIPVLPTPKQMADGVTQIKEGMKRIGREYSKLRVAYGGSNCTLIAKDEKQLKKLAEPLICSMGKSIEESTCLIGTPEGCIQKIEQYQKAGAQHIVAGFYDFPSIEGLKLFAKSVIPHFR
jgi:alkanesulfonate monooxygenase SsuD/methylene tetrahydromethanopterin reductase-like flavin-dependent oxidoreductase (luciferase family)